MFRTPWASIARIEVDGKHSGTGFLVPSGHVLTALHVVADKNTGRPYRRIRLFFDTNAEFEDGSQIYDTTALVAKRLWNIEHDFALLECKVPDGATPLRLSDRCVPFDKCSSPGFAIQKPSGFTVSGYVSSLNEPMDGGSTALGVQFEFGSGVRMRGHSGAPLLVRDRVVGFLRTAFKDESDFSAGGIVHSTAVQHVVDFCNGVVPGLLSCRATVRWPSLAATQCPLLLADRRPEFELFQRMISGQSRERILLLEGESGIGKSTLLHELAKYADPLGVPIGKADCKGAPPLSDLFDSLLLSFPDALFPATRAATGTQRYSLMLEEIADLGWPVVIQIDTWDESGDAVRQWTVKTISSALSTNPGLIVMVAGPHMELLKKACPPDLCVLRPLQAILSITDWHDYAVRRWPNTGLTHAHVEGSVITFAGVPLNVEANLALLQRSLPIASLPGGAS